MALSKCGHCKGTLFEVVEKEPSGANVKIMFVQCSKCGNPIGAMDYYSIGSLVKGLEKRIKALEAQNQQIGSIVTTIDHNVRVIASKLR